MLVRVLRRLLPVAVLAAALVMPGVATAAPTCTTSFVPASGNWSTAANWSTGVVPSTYDVACVPAGATVTVTTTAQAGVLWAPSATLVVSGYSLTLSDVSSPSQVANLVVAYGELTGAATLNVSGALSWSGGKMSGSGATVLGPSSTAAVSTPNYGDVILDTRTLRNEGTFTWTKGAIRGSTAR